MVLKSLRALCLLLALCGASASFAVPEYTLKFATLAPPGSTWMNLIDAWGKEVESQSKGRLVFKFYPGGVSGDEPDVLRKIRFGQLHGGAFTGFGIGQIHSPARVLELPFLFRDLGEVDHARAAFSEEFARGFHDAGFEHLGWMEVGFVHFFSKHPVQTLDELKPRRIWLWQGDRMGEAFFKASKLSPVPLSVLDVYTSLSTGLVDTVYSTPLASIAMQWFTQTPYMSAQPMTNAMGVLLVDSRFFDRLPEDLRALLKTSGARAGEALIAATRTDNAKSLDVLKRQGLKLVMNDGKSQEAEFLAIRDRAAAELMQSGYLPRDLVERTRGLLDSYRAQRETTH
jgi:TRAP-type C4-dicarboxylate transport system substrate-binding protein